MLVQIRLISEGSGGDKVLIENTIRVVEKALGTQFTARGGSTPLRVIELSTTSKKLRDALLADRELEEKYDKLMEIINAD